MFIMPELSPILTSMLMATRASFGQGSAAGSAPSRCVSNAESRVVTLCHADFRFCRMIRSRPSRILCSISVISRVIFAENFTAAAQQHFQNGKHQGRVQFEDRVAFSRASCE